MKITGIIILTLLLSNFRAFGQTYNEVVPDSIIVNFMNDILTSEEPYQSAFNKLPKKVFYKPIHLKDANWDFRDLPDSTSFEIKFEELLKKVELTQEDINFLQNQYSGIIDTTWQLSIKKVSFKKKYRKKQIKYSIPIFTADYQTAIFWRYLYCGSLCAYSEVHTYKLVNGKWELDLLIQGWIS